SVSLQHPAVASTILAFADLQPGPESTFVTRDLPFLRIVSPLMLGLPVSAERLATEDLNRLVAFDGEAPAVVDALFTLATDHGYGAKVEEIERALGDTNAWSTQARNYFTAPTVEPKELGRRRALLAAEPRLSSLPYQVVQAYKHQRGLQPGHVFDPGDDV